MRVNKDCWIFNIPIAHRGLWGGNIIENSLSAYQNAIDKGYAIEIDLYLSTDGEIFSFHDKTLNRMTGTDGYIFEKTSKQIKGLSLANTENQIPTFDEVLNLVNGKVPLVIEIKDQPNKSIVDKTVERLKKYSGEFAIQSFNPFYINRVKKLAPQFIRGILATKTHGKDLKPITRYIVKNMSLNFLIKPDFISYSHEDLPLKKRKTKTPLITWTVTSEKTLEQVRPYAKNIIFEHFTPKIPY